MMKSFYGIEDSHLKLKEENAKLLAERQDLEDLRSKNAEMPESISQLEKQISQQCELRRRTSEEEDDGADSSEVKNPLEENEVVGITNYIDFGFELQSSTKSIDNLVKAEEREFGYTGQLRRSKQYCGICKKVWHHSDGGDWIMDHSVAALKLDHHQLFAFLQGRPSGDGKSAFGERFNVLHKTHAASDSEDHEPVSYFMLSEDHEPVSWIPVNLIFIGMLVSGMYSLKYINVAMVTILKNVTNILTAIGEYYVFRKRQKQQVWTAMFLMIDTMSLDLVFRSGTDSE
nr:GDP-mannose transporter GONST2-like isoform X2 [Ipomoea trifida]